MKEISKDAADQKQLHTKKANVVTFDEIMQDITKETEVEHTED